MEAVRLHPNPDQLHPYSVAHPAPSSALVLDTDVPIPQPLKPGELLIRVEATTVTRDSLTWPETYLQEYTIMGHDFAGTVVATGAATESSVFKPGDEVYGMVDASRGGMWAEYAIVLETEACLKPKSLTFAQAAAVPMSGLTAYQALFEKAALPVPDFKNLSDLKSSSRNKPQTRRSSILITGASGGVGLHLVQLARLANLHVVAATRSNARNMDVLKRLGADDVVEYNELTRFSLQFDVIVDTIGGVILESCWSLVRRNGAIVSIDSASFNFVAVHQRMDIAAGRKDVKALFFIVAPSTENLRQLSAVLEAEMLVPFVASVFSLADARAAYDTSMSGSTARGKIVLVSQSDILQ